MQATHQESETASHSAAHTDTAESKTTRTPGVYLLITQTDSGLDFIEATTRADLKAAANGVLAKGGTIVKIYRGARTLSVKVQQVANF